MLRSDLLQRIRNGSIRCRGLINPDASRSSKILLIRNPKHTGTGTSDISGFDVVMVRATGEFSGRMEMTIVAVDGRRCISI